MRAGPRISRDVVDALLINLLGFLLAFSILLHTPGLLSMSSDGGSGSGGRGVSAVQARPQHIRIIWVTTSLTDKTRVLSPLYVVENGITRPLTVTEWTSWKSRTAAWFQDIGLTGFITLSEAMITVDVGGLTFAPMYSGARPLTEILEDTAQQKHVFKLLKSHSWNLPNLPSAADIEKADDTEIDFQFKFIAGALYKILNAIIIASAPEKDRETGMGAYDNIFNSNNGPLVLVPGVHNPLAALMSIPLLNNYFKSSLSGTVKQMEDNLQAWIEAVTKGPAAPLSLANQREFLSIVNSEFWAIANKDAQGVYTLNRNLQESVSKGLQFACIRAEKSAISEEVQLRATELKIGIIALKQFPTFSQYYTAICALCTQIVPANSGIAKTVLPSIADVTQGSPSGAQHASTSAMAASFSPTDMLQCGPCGGINMMARAYGLAAVQGAVSQASTTCPLDWMCEHCCQRGHRCIDCTNPPHKDRVQLLQDHRAKKAEKNAQTRQRKHARNNNSPAGRGGGGEEGRQVAPGGAPAGRGGRQGGQGRGRGARQQQGPQGQPLRITFPNDVPMRGGRAAGGNGGRAMSDIDDALAAFHTHGSNGSGQRHNARFEDVTDQYEEFGNLSTPTTCTATPTVASLTMPIFLMLAITGLCAAHFSTVHDDLMIGLVTVLLPLVLALHFVVPLASTQPGYATRFEQPMRPRSKVFSWLRSGFTATLVVLAILLHLSWGANAANTTHSALMTSEERLTRVFIDTGCSRTLFCSDEPLVNIRPLSPPVRIGGSVPGSALADRMGDFPLILTDEDGVNHLRIIKNCMIAPAAQANLLSHNELRKAKVGIIVPDNETDPAMLFWRRPGGDSSMRFYQTLGCSHGLIPLPASNGQMAEITEGSSEAAYFAARPYALNATHHQLRPITLQEKLHHRLGHAHPAKIAKLSHNCIGIKEPIAEFRVPCHDCTDANIRRSDLPPASERIESGVMSVDMIDIGAKHLTLNKNRYLTVFVNADTRYAMIFLHKTKDEFPQLLKQALARVSKMPRILRTDGAGEYMSPAANQILLDRGIQKQTSNPDEQFGNAKAESMLASIGRGIRVALLSSGLGPEFWGLAAQNWIDIYNHLPHAALQFKTPWEAETSSQPDISWFRPFGCRVTVFRGRDNVAHHKLAPRGEPCIYVGLGFSQGQKGWFCWSPQTKRMYCTRNCVFDETFMPMRLTDQRILGYYDTTPRTKMVQQQFGSVNGAAKASDDLWDLPVDFEPEPVDPDSPEITDPPPHFHNQEGEGLLDDEPSSSDVGKRPAADTPAGPAPKRPRDSSTAQASGGDTARASGGDTARASGGGTARVSGGSNPRIPLAGGGANTGVDPSMLSAGDPGSASSHCHVEQVLDDNFDWTKLGPRHIRDVTNHELTEWLIGHGITLRFKRDFWPDAKSSGPWQGFVHDTTRLGNSPWALLWLFTTRERHKVRITDSSGIDLTIRDAVRDTYPSAITLDDLHSQFLGSDLVKDPAHAQRNEPDRQQQPGSKKARKTKRNESPEPEHQHDDTEQHRDGRPRRNVTAHYTAMAFACMQEALGIPSAAAEIRHRQRPENRLRMFKDSAGHSFTAFMATAYACQMAQSFGYQAAFLPPEPKSQRDARSRADSDMWENAEQEELGTLWKMGTFQLVDRPARYDQLPLHFVYKLKVKDGDFDNVRHKARLVMCGNLQYEHEYGETYAPTARLWSLRTLTAIAAQEGLSLKKFDLTGAFLVADMDKELYVEIPGYDVPSGKALLLKKALYGGRSSGALYAKEITTWLKSYGFEPSSVDETLFRLEREGRKGKEVILLSLYVDDGACATNSEPFYQEFMAALQSKYQLSDQGKLEWHLGMKITQDLKRGTIKLDQKAYIEAMLKRFDMVDANERDTPLPPKVKYSKADCPAVPDKKVVKAYQQLVGSLMYVACCTRPDVAYAVNTCAQFMSNPGPRHIDAAKYILRYLKGTKDVGITYSKQTDDLLANRLFGYVDADHASDADDRKSVGGYVLMLNGGAISWSSRKIKVVAISSFESEWYSASICGCEVKAMRRLLEEMGYPQSAPTTLFEDNAACIYSSEADRPMNPCSKHIDIRVFKLKEFVQEGTLKLVKVATERQMADNLTKPLHKIGVDMARAVMSGEEAVRQARARATSSSRTLFGFAY